MSQSFQKLKETQRETFKRYLIDELHVPIYSKPEDFEPDESEITFGLVVKDEHQWDSHDSSPFTVRLSLKF